MSDQYSNWSDPEKLDYNNTLRTVINVREIAKLLGLDRKLEAYFKHAVYYLNMLFDDVADPADVGQIFDALSKIEQEQIPNVQIMSNQNREVHTQMLKDKAVFLLAKASIRGLDEAEFDLLIKLLKVLLSEEDYPKAEVLVDKIKNADPKEVWTPIEPRTLNEYLRMNWGRLEQ